MENLEEGKFYGISKTQFYLNGLTIVDSQFYHYVNCPWHYHHNAHFAFTTKGNLVETHKKKQIQLSAGSLVYNHSNEPHCNSKYSDMVSALHIDIDTNWFRRYDINYAHIEGVKEIRSPVIKNVFHKLFKEVKCFDNASHLSMESMVLQSVNEMIHTSALQKTGSPGWIFKTKDLLYDRYDQSISLQEIALEINIHPVYLCQQFPIYFHCTFGDYIRKIKIEKAVELMLRSPHLSLTRIAYACGFSDQSHFIRLFKKNIGVTPLAFRRMIGNS
jgi:AraC family transcriptional regulator